MPRPTAAWTTERIRLTAGSAALVTVLLVAVTVLRNLVITAQQPLGWGVASFTAAMLLAPVARRYDRRTGRGLAIALAVVPVVVVALVLGIRLATEVREQVGRVEVVLPAAARALESDTGPGRFARDLQLGDRVEDVVADIGTRIAQRATLARAVGTVPAYLVNAILVVFFLVWGRRFWEGFLRQLPDDDRRERVAAAVTGSIARGRWYVLAVVAQGAVLGTVVGLICWSLDLPAPAVLGLAVAVASLVPYVGIVLGAVPVLLVAAASQPLWVTAALAAAAVLAQAAAVVLAGRVIHPRSVHVGPAPIVVAALVGAAIYGAGGGAVLVVLTIVGVAALDRSGAASSTAVATPDDPF